MPAIAQIVTSCLTCTSSTPTGGTKRNRKMSWVEFGEEILKVTESAVYDLVKVVNPSLHDSLVTSTAENDTPSTDLFESMRGHKGSPPVEIIQASIQAAVQTAVQSAVKEALKARTVPVPENPEDPEDPEEVAEKPTGDNANLS